MSTWMKRRIERSRARCQRAAQKEKPTPPEQKGQQDKKASAHTSRAATPYIWTRDEVV
jgi:hypothetical protein